MNRKILIHSKVWSNLFFLIPLTLTLYYQLYFHSMIIFLLIISSTSYHLSKEKKYKIIDKIFAYLLIGFNFYLFFLSKINNIFPILALIVLLSAFYFYFIKKRDDYEWHFCSALITTFCILGYILSY